MAGYRFFNGGYLHWHFDLFFWRRGDIFGQLLIEEVMNHIMGGEKMQHIGGVFLVVDVAAKVDQVLKLLGPIIRTFLRGKKLLGCST